MLASTQALSDSPILGHGSWAKEFAYVDLLAERRSLGYEVGAGYYDVGLIPAHSYLMGSWVWAGFLGGLFGLSILGIVVWLLASLYSFHVDLAPVFVFSTMILLWNIAFSTYGFSARLTAPYGIAVCLLGLVTGDARVRYEPGTLAGAATRASVGRRTIFQVDVPVAGPSGGGPR